MSTVQPRHRAISRLAGGGAHRRAHTVRPKRWFAVLAGVAFLAVGIFVGAPVASGVLHPSEVTTKNFHLFPNVAFLACSQQTGQTATVQATVKRGALNDTLTLTLSGFKANLGFDLFTVQRSNQTSDGSPVSGFTNFGMAWYQSDIETNADGHASVSIKTILLDQIFGFDPDASLTPQQTLHVGFWFDSVAEAQPCSGTTLTPTPFNGEHNAGPVAFITRPNATTGLGPLCTKTMKSGGVFSCKP
jgi:hypothetical protein